MRAGFNFESGPRLLNAHIDFADGHPAYTASTALGPPDVTIRCSAAASRSAPAAGRVRGRRRASSASDTSTSGRGGRDVQAGDVAVPLYRAAGTPVFYQEIPAQPISYSTTLTPAIN